MLTCKEVSYLASKKLDEGLALKQRLGFWLHINMCKLCRHYARDIKKFHQLVKKTGKNGVTFLPESTGLSQQSRERIKQAIDKALQQTQ